MKKRDILKSFPVILLLITITMACSFLGYSLQRNQEVPSKPPTIPPIPIVESPLPQLASNTSTPEPPTLAPTTAVPPTATEEPTITPTPTITHLEVPADKPPAGGLVYDVISKDTAPELRAPYGDSYQINRLERPFLQNMKYVPDLDIVTYRVSWDKDWIYVSIALVGNDPNNELGIDYAVELDTNEDGFGDYVIWAHPPYVPKWETSPVEVFADKNKDTGGLSPMKSDAPFKGDGYDTLIFKDGMGDDPDLAWVRINAGRDATVQFAFKKTLPGNTYLLGVIADAGLKDQTKLDYIDRFTEQEAGSPVRSNKNYPLNELFAVDNACRQAFGFTPSGDEPQLCPIDEPTPKPRATISVCPAPPSCIGQWYKWNSVTCTCEYILY